MSNLFGKSEVTLARCQKCSLTRSQKHKCIFYEIADRLNHRQFHANIYSYLDRDSMNHSGFEA